MKKILPFCALCALWGCRQVVEPSGEVIALYCSTSEQSKTDVLTSGDQISVFACTEGTEQYFLEHVTFIVGTDGRSLSTTPAVYYPEAKQEVNFYAYFPYHSGTFSVPSDQTTSAALKQADLCWATASSTPVASAVPLEFAHQMARLLITTNTPTTKIVAPNVCSGGTLHIRTGVFTNMLKSDISTTGNELIVPVQPLARLVLTVSGVEYVFDTAPIALQAGQTTTLNLTLHPASHTATLSGSSTTNWISSASEGNPTQAVSNILTLHWPTIPQGATSDKITFTIDRMDYTVASGITYADKAFTVPFASAALRYPYTITQIAFNNIPLACTQLLGATIYKSGASTMGIKDVPNAILINGLWWATGNLVASNAAAGEHGLGGCRIGEPMDGGLYFQFGSLIGYKGGNQINSGTGVGMPQAPLDINGTFWNGSGFSWKSDAMVWPNAMTDTPVEWPANYGTEVGDRNTVVDQWFFNYNTAPYSTARQDIRGLSTSFPGDAGAGTLATGRYAKWGLGDPCTYYLGIPWRLPTTTELASITGKTGSNWIKWTTAGVTGRWATASDTFARVSGPGAWFGAGLNAGVGTPTATNLFLSASGSRNPLAGSFGSVAVKGNVWSSSVLTASLVDFLDVHESYGVVPQNNYYRSTAFPVRCVSDAP